MKKFELLYEIDKNIPIPEHAMWGKNLGFLKKLEVGDSFVVEKKARSSLVTSARRMGMKFITRTIENGKVRIWRTE